MRTIKFRAWDRSENYWVELTHLTIHMSGNLLDVPSDIILMQFTGLKDKNGKDIYEGDIVTSHTPFDHWQDKVSVVKYEGGTWNYSYALQEFADTPEKQWEVIGNIFENSDLLPKDE